MKEVLKEWREFLNEKEKPPKNLTYRFLNLIKEQAAEKRALIIGDSQGGSSATGGALTSILSNAGYKVVNKSKYGSFTAQAAGQIPDKNFDLVILFTGGHFKSRPADAIKIAKMFPNTTNFIISGPPPVQRIKDVSGSVKKFPYLKNVPKESLETYFVNPQDQRAKSMYRGRERRNNAFKQAASSIGLSYVDPRVVFGVTNPADFPVVSNSDGIHMYGDIASQVATAIAGVIDQQLKAAPTQTKKKPTTTKVIQAAKQKAPRCLKNNILALGAGIGKYKDLKDRVEVLQQMLVDKKLTKNPKDFVDGEFGTKTLMAVIGAQALSHLKPDGCAGPQTLAALGITSDTVAPEKAKKAPAGGVKVTQDTVTVGGKNYKAIGTGEDSSTKHIYVGRNPRPSNANRFLNFISDRGSYGMNEQQGEDPSNLSMIDLINFVAKKMNIPPEVLLAVSWTETGGSPKKVFSMSFDGSYGLTQVCRPVPERKWDSFWRGHLTIYRRQFMKNPEKYGGFKPEYKYLDDKSYNQRRKVLYKVPGGGTVKGEAIEKEYTRRRHPRSKIKPFRGCPDTFGGYWRRLETGKGVPQLDKEFMDKYMTKQRGDEVKTKQDKIKFMITDLMIGAAEMRRQLSRYKEDLRKAFPAYNAGSFRQNKQFKDLSSKTGAPIAFNENYQNKILTAYAWLREKAGKQVELVDVEGFDGDFKA